jgi:hypothetical protein
VVDCEGDFIRQLKIAVIGALMIGIGLYFFPLGEDIVFKTILDSTGGDYWLARLYQYAIFGSLIVMGVLLLKFGPGMFKLYGLLGLGIVGALVLGIV